MSDINSAVVSVTSTSSGGQVILNPRTRRSSVIIRNEGTATVFIGGASPDADGTSLTMSTGFPLDADQSLSFDDLTGPLYGVVASGTADIRVLEVY